MIEPYYQDDAATIYHGDCREVMPSLDSVSLVVADPPYGIAFQSARRIKRERFDPIVDDKLVRTDWVASANRLLHDGGALYLFARWDILGEWQSVLNKSIKSCIVWDRVVHGLGDLDGAYAPQHDLCLFIPVGKHRFRNGRPKDVIRHQRVDPRKLFHPAEKPISLIEELLTNSSDVGDFVLDPFLGSGTTLVAAKNLGRQAIGIEIEERYCEIAAKRLAQQVIIFD